MDIKRSGSRSASEGSREWFTGKVRVEPLFRASAPGRAQGARVTFEPSARTAWHNHPLGQTLIVTEGRGFVQSQAGPGRSSVHRRATLASHSEECQVKGSYAGPWIRH